MPLKAEGPATDVQEIDRWEGGAGWLAHPEEGLGRASHALASDGDVWVVDPVDGEGVDDILASLGDVVGVVVTLDRHVRDAGPIADRHDVPAHVPRSMDDVAKTLSSWAPIERVDDRLPGTEYRITPVVDNALWTEVSLYRESDGTLLVPEAVGTTEYYTVGDERLGVHPMLRPFPPRERLGAFAPDRVLVGHGTGVVDDAAAALTDALASARRRAPALYARTVRRIVLQ